MTCISCYLGWAWPSLAAKAATVALAVAHALISGEPNLLINQPINQLVNQLIKLIYHSETRNEKN